eukprot:Nk52_evm32s1569 gene=Nk52_evmTU32s1569
MLCHHIPINKSPGPYNSNSLSCLFEDGGAGDIDKAASSRKEIPLYCAWTGLDTCVINHFRISPSNEQLTSCGNNKNTHGQQFCVEYVKQSDGNVSKDYCCKEYALTQSGINGETKAGPRASEQLLKQPFVKLIHIQKQNKSYAISAFGNAVEVFLLPGVQKISSDVLSQLDAPPDFVPKVTDVCVIESNPSPSSSCYILLAFESGHILHYEFSAKATLQYRQRIIINNASIISLHTHPSLPDSLIVVTAAGCIMATRNFPSGTQTWTSLYNVCDDHQYSASSSSSSSRFHPMLIARCSELFAIPSSCNRDQSTLCLAVGMGDGSVMVFRIFSKNVEGESAGLLCLTKMFHLRCHHSEVNSLAVDVERNLLITAGAEGILRLWNIDFKSGKFDSDARVWSITVQDDNSHLGSYVPLSLCLNKESGLLIVASFECPFLAVYSLSANPV